MRSLHFNILTSQINFHLYLSVSYSTSTAYEELIETIQLANLQAELILYYFIMVILIIHIITIKALPLGYLSSVTTAVFPACLITYVVTCFIHKNHSDVRCDAE